MKKYLLIFLGVSVDESVPGVVITELVDPFSVSFWQTTLVIVKANRANTVHLKYFMFLDIVKELSDKWIQIYE